MKSNKMFHPNSGQDDVMRKAVKLAPMKKSGKDRHTMYNGIEDDEDEFLDDYKQKESVFDYYDDEEE